MKLTEIDLRIREVAGVNVPSPGLGCMGLSQAYGKADDEESKELLRHAIKIGCTFWDSADLYGSGHNEKLIGEVLKENDNRSKVFIASKFGHELNFKTGERTGNIRGDAAYIREAIEHTLKNLGTTPDLYYQHRVDPNVSLEETYSTLEQLRKEGKFKYLGISECNSETLRKVAKITKIDALQIEYSPWTIDIEKNGLLDAARELGIPIIAYSPLGRGFLTGRWRSSQDFAPDDSRAKMFPRFNKDNFDANFKLVETLESIAKKKGVTPAQLSIAWVSAQGKDIIPIPGTKTIERLEENWASRDIKFKEEELKEIRNGIDAFHVTGDRYPEFMMKHLGH